VVPQRWINILKGNVTEPLEKRSEKDKISLDKLSCRSATKYFVKSKFVMATAERRMKEASLKEHIVYSLLFNVTKDTTLAIFQYKLIHHILPTNLTLLRESIKEHDKCHLCGERQTLTHLFVTCLEARLFWSLFTNWWSSKNGDTRRMTLDKNEIIYGMTDNFAHHLNLNLCLIIAKYYLYAALRKEEEFSFDAFLAILTNKIKIEKQKSQIIMGESLLL